MSQARFRVRRTARVLLVNLVVGLIAVGLNSDPVIRGATGPLLPIVLWSCLGVFALHWLRRLQQARRGGGAGAWLRSLPGAIETLSVIAVPVAFLLGAAEPWLAGTLWILRLIPASPSLGQLGRVLSTEARALSGVGALFLIVLVLSAALMHAIEGGGQPGSFGTLPGALWWSVVTLTTTGYGDVVPRAPLGKLIAALVMMSGLCVFGLLTGILATGFAAESRRQDFLRSWEVVRHVPFFGSLSQSGIADLARALRRWDTAENTVVVRRGRRGDSMYFVVSGEVEVEVDPPVRIGPGGFFGEMALLGEGVRSATVTTTRSSTLLVLDIADFRTMMALHPELAGAVEFGGQGAPRTDGDSSGMIVTSHAEHRERVRPEWADAAGELGAAFAVVIFDHAIDLLYDGIGIGEAYRAATDFSTFTLETHSLLEQPVPADEEVLVRSHILAVDAKRMHIAQEMFRPGRTRRAALMEQLSIHIDLSVRRSAPFPPERLAQIRAAMEMQRDWPRPHGTGRRITLATP